MPILAVMAEETGRMAYVLNNAQSVEPQRIPGVRGRWAADQPVLPEDIGMTAGELDDLIRERNLPIVRVRLDATEVKKHEKAIWGDRNEGGD